VLHNKFKVEDVLQNTFLKAMLTIRDNRYQENGKFKFWIQRIAHNTLIDFLRFEKSEQKIFTDNFGLDLYNDYRLSEGTIEDRIVYKQVCRNVKKMLKFLPDDQQEILVLRYYNGLTYKEIAIYLGVSVNTALGRVRYAIRNMRKMTKIHTTILSLS
ncbi:MAG: RNA polymerase sigma factor, partial [Tannerellaceae bacterium]|nr:RNA polymerase sigma factor [Tannerellaceae bacterium]